MSAQAGSPATGTTRLDRRKARTREALISAARTILAERGTADVSIQEITELADVGFGSFYNHFTSKAELFEQAVAEALEEYGQILDDRTEGIDDPAEIFAARMRLTGRLARSHQHVVKIVLRVGLDLLGKETGLSPRALRDLRRGMESGRFSVQNPFVALACAGGSLLAFLRLTMDHPEMVDESLADEFAQHVLLMLGMSPEAAREVAHRPLPPGPAHLA
jgi:AcrR family transcriptional regulator